jgi:hypothetical protein
MLPRLFGRGFVVARGRIVVKAVIGALIPAVSAAQAGSRYARLNR